MTTKSRYLTHYKPGKESRKEIKSLADFLEAVHNGEDLWSSGNRHEISWWTDSSFSEYQALNALGWGVASDYDSYEGDWIYVYSPHPKPFGDSEEL